MHNAEVQVGRSVSKPGRACPRPFGVLWEQGDSCAGPSHSPTPAVTLFRFSLTLRACPGARPFLGKWPTPAGESVHPSAEAALLRAGLLSDPRMGRGQPPAVSPCYSPGGSPFPDGRLAWQLPCHRRPESPTLGGPCNSGPVLAPPLCAEGCPTLLREVLVTLPRAEGPLRGALLFVV